MSFAGTHTALVTPFRNGAIDSKAFRELIEAQIAGGVEGIVAVGTTGESPTLTHEEHIRVIVGVEIRRGSLQGHRGNGSNSTSEAVSLTTGAEKLGSDAALLVAPYYNKPSPEGLYRHYRVIAEAVKIQIVLYSIPGRCGIEIGVETVARLATDCANIVLVDQEARSSGSASFGGASATLSRSSPATIRSRCRFSRPAESASSASRRT